MIVVSKLFIEIHRFTLQPTNSGFQSWRRKR